MENFILYIIKVNLFAAICICLVYLLSRLVRRKYSSLWRYYTWLFIAIFLIVPFGLFREAEVVSMEVPYQWGVTETTGAAADVESIASESEADTNSFTEADNQVNLMSYKQSILDLTISDLSRAAMYVWIGVALGLAFIRVMIYYISLHSFKRWAVPIKKERYLKLYHQICKENGIRRYPRLLLSPKLSSPALAGLIRPVLCLPEAEYTEDELKLIFKHELHHYKNKDLWYKLFLLLVGTVYWFNPFLYLMRKEAENDLEYICDGNVIKASTYSERTIYHRLLLRTAEHHNCIHYISASLNDDMTDFKERIMYMIKLKTLKKGRIFVVMFITVFICANLLVGCSAGKAKDKAEDKKDSSVESVAETDDDKSDEIPADNSESETGDQSNNTAQTDNQATASKDKEVDKSGDYMGDITCPNPPKDSSYRIHNNVNADEAIVIYITNLDDANIKFHLTKASYNSEIQSDSYTEKVIFKEHIAHYNGDGYYEYIGKDYHLYFKYDAAQGEVAGDHTMAVYGLSSIIDANQYGGDLSYNGTSGNLFVMGLPFAG